jgi:S-adenosylmethionine decarboxylase
MTTIQRWGYHLILDVSKCSPRSIRCPSNIHSFSSELVKRIDMVPYGKPQIVMFGSGNKKGYTLVQLIETSNICGHFVEETDDMYLDVFSCKKFDIPTVEEIIQKYFKPLAVKKVYLERNAEHVVIDNPSW